MKNKKIIITGATGGIGEKLVEIFAKENAELFLIASSVEKLQKLQKGIEGKSQIFAADLKSESGILATADFISKINDPDILINLAGTSYFGSLGKEDPAKIATLYNINLLAPTILSQSVLPQMIRKNSGQIVNISSIFGSIAFPFVATYSASKAGLRGFSEALRRELSSTGIKVSYVALRTVKTKFNDPLLEEFNHRIKATFDAPEEAAQKIFTAIKKQKKNSYFGPKESFFVHLNYMLPGLVDCALKSNAKVAAEILTRAQK